MKSGGFQPKPEDIRQQLRMEISHCLLTAEVLACLRYSSPYNPSTISWSFILLVLGMSTKPKDGMEALCKFRDNII